MIISCYYKFNAAMRLPDYQGICAQDHGYDFDLRVGLQVPVSEATEQHTIAVDFVDVDAVVEEKVLALLHRSSLNDTVQQPTLERIAMWIMQQLIPVFNNLVFVDLSAADRYQVRLYTEELGRVP